MEKVVKIRDYTPSLSRTDLLVELVQKLKRELARDEALDLWNHPLNQPRPPYKTKTEIKQKNKEAE